MSGSARLRTLGSSAGMCWDNIGCRERRVVRMTIEDVGGL